MDIQAIYSVQDVVLKDARRKVPRSKLYRNGGYHPHKRQTLKSGRTGKARRITGWMDTLFLGMEDAGRDARRAIREREESQRRERAARKHVIAGLDKARREQASRERSRGRKAALEDKRYREEVLPGKLAAGVIECLFGE